MDMNLEKLQIRSWKVEKKQLKWEEKFENKDIFYL